MRKLTATDYQSKEIIRFIREWTELTQKEFAQSINRKTNYIIDWKRLVVPLIKEQTNIIIGVGLVNSKISLPTSIFFKLQNV